MYPVEEIIDGMFAERVSNPMAWFQHSRALLASARSTVERANLLIDEVEKSELMNVATMLYGFSLENLFKAVWIYDEFGSSHSEEWMPEAKFPRELKTHDLVKLAKLALPNLINKYEFSLSILTDVTTWSGRYPCSLKGDEGTIGRIPQVNDDAEKIYKLCSKKFTITS